MRTCEHCRSPYDARSLRTGLCTLCDAEIPKRKPGRPKTDDPRTMRVKMNGKEWSHCEREAKKAGAKSTAAWVRDRCGL